MFFQLNVRLVIPEIKLQVLLLVIKGWSVEVSRRYKLLIFQRSVLFYWLCGVYFV